MMSNIKNSFNSLLEALKFKGKKKEFTEFFNNIKKTFSNNKHLSDILKKYYSKEKITEEDNILLKKVIKDNLRLVGIGTLSILSFPIPGSTILVLFLIKGAKKVGIDLVPSEFKKIEESMDTQKVIDITKMSNADWAELQLNVIEDCFPGIELKVIPVKVNTSKSNAATFRCTINRISGDIRNKHFTFNKMLRWTEEKLNNVMAHEMIHYYLSNIGRNDGHGYNFRTQMRRITDDTTNNYTVTVRDDEFIPDEKYNEVMSLYFIDFKNNRNFFSTSDINIIKEHESSLLKNNITEYDVYQVTKTLEIKKGLKNSRKFGFFSFRDHNAIKEIINDENTKFIKNIKIDSNQVNKIGEELSDIYFVLYELKNGDKTHFHATSNLSSIYGATLYFQSYNIVGYDIYKVAKSTVSLYSLKNSRKFSFYSFRNPGSIKSLLGLPTTQHVKYVKV